MEFNKIGDLVYELPRTNIFNLDDIRARVEKSKSRIDMYKSKYGDKWQKEYVIGEGFYSEHNKSMDLRHMNDYILWGGYLNEPRWDELDPDAVAEYHKVLNDRLKVLFGSDYESVWKDRMKDPDFRFELLDKLLADAKITGNWQELPSYLRRMFCDKELVPYIYKDVEVVDGDLHCVNFSVERYMPSGDGDVMSELVYRDNRSNAICHAADSVYAYCHEFVDYNYLWLLRFAQMHANVNLPDVQFYEDAGRKAIEFYKVNKNKDVCGRTFFGGMIDELSINEIEKAERSNVIGNAVFAVKQKFVNHKHEDYFEDLVDKLRGLPDFMSGKEDVYIPRRYERLDVIKNEFRMYDRFYGIGWREWSLGLNPVQEANGVLLNSHKFCSFFTDGFDLRQAISCAQVLQDYRLMQFYGFDRFALDNYLPSDKRVIELLLLDAVNTGDWIHLPESLYYLYHKFIGVFDGTESFGY